MKRILTLTFALAIALAVMASDKATAYFTLNPVMTCQNCENKVKSNLRYEKGVKDIVTSVPDQLVTVTYDPAKTSPENLIAAFKNIGYTATQTDKTPKSGCAKAEGKACCKKAEGKACCKKAEGNSCCKKAEGKACCKKAASTDKKCEKDAQQCGNSCKK